MCLSAEQLKNWKNQGCLHLPGFFGDGDTLSGWTDELYSWPEKSGAWMKYFESAMDGQDRRMLCRVENFLSFHDGWRGTIEDQHLFDVLKNLFQEEAILFGRRVEFSI